MPRKRELPDLTCVVCGASFYKPPSHRAKWPGQTCSRTCAAVLRRDSVERTCQVCGTTFSAKPSSVSKGFGLYCSKACNGIADRRRVERTCETCGCKFEVPKHLTISTSAKYCCTECLHGVPKRYGIQPSQNRFKERHLIAWLRDACARCGATSNLQLDHIVPRFAGGMPVEDNAQTLCRTCNREKHHRDDLPRYLGITPSS